MAMVEEAGVDDAPVVVDDWSDSVCAGDGHKSGGSAADSEWNDEHLATR